MAEALAFRDALNLAEHRQLKKIIVEGDSKIVIDAVSEKFVVPWRIRTIVYDVK